MEASAPTHPRIEPEPPEWQLRALTAGARLLCGAWAFFYVAFLFAYFYLRSLDLNEGWTVGHHVTPAIGYGIAIVVVLVGSAVLLRLAALRPAATVTLGSGALVLALGSIAIQCIQYAELSFGPANGAYASVFIGWTGSLAFFTLLCAYWIETQVASIWRLQRGEVQRALREGVPTPDTDLAYAGVRACSFFWSFYVALAFIAFVILYLA